MGPLPLQAITSELSPHEVRQLCVIQHLLLEEAEAHSRESWRSAVLQGLLSLFRADAAGVITWTGGAPSGIWSQGVEGLREHASLLQTVGIEAANGSPDGGTWVIRTTDPTGSAKTALLRDKLLGPNHVKCAFGIGVKAGPLEGANLSLHTLEDLPPNDLNRRLMLLNTVMPAFRSAVCREIGWEAADRRLLSLMDVMGQGMALFDDAGSALFENYSVQQILVQEQDHDQVRDVMGQLARAVLREDPNGSGPGAVQAYGNPAAQLRRDCTTPRAIYRMAGHRVGQAGFVRGSRVIITLERITPRPERVEELRSRFGLTARESQVATLLLRRLTNNEIAEMLGISEHTARHHTESVLLKIGVNSRASLRTVLDADGTFSNAAGSISPSETAPPRGGNGTRHGRGAADAPPAAEPGRPR